MAKDLINRKALPITPLANIRIKRGMTQAQLADLVGCSQQLVAKWERGETLPRLDHARKLSTVLVCSLEALFPID